MRQVTADTTFLADIARPTADTMQMKLSSARAIRALLHFVAQIGRLGFGRQAALVAARRVFPTRAQSVMRQTAALVAAATFIGVGVSLLRQANLGLPPYDVLVSALQPRLHISFGQTVWAISGVLFLVAAILGQRPNRWGIAYVLVVGSAIDAVSALINAPASLLGRFAFVGIAVLVLSVGISLVVHAGSTGGSFELLMKAGEERGLDRVRVRTGLEVTILVTGIILGGSFGPATFVVALGIGPCLGAASQMLQDHAEGRTRRLMRAHLDADVSADSVSDEEIMKPLAR